MVLLWMIDLGNQLDLDMAKPRSMVTPARRAVQIKLPEMQEWHELSFTVTRVAPTLRSWLLERRTSMGKSSSCQVLQ
jgi:hypothetical protein